MTNINSINSLMASIIILHFSLKNYGTGLLIFLSIKDSKHDSMKILWNNSIKNLMLEMVWILRSTSASHTFFVANSFLFAPDLNYGCPIIDPALLPAQPIFWVRLDILKTFYSFFYSCYTGVLGQKHIILVVDTHMLISSHPDCNVHAQLRS